MNFLIVGCGSIGKRHINNLLSLKQSVIACDLNEELLLEVKEKFHIETFSDYEIALKQDIDAVFICTSTSFHIPNALTALNHDCHVFIEKPISHTLDGIDELKKLAVEKDKIVMVGFMLRFNRLLLKVKELLDNRTIGKILNIRAQCGFNLEYWPKKDYSKSYSAQKKLGGGIILDATHEFDYLQWLLGDIKELVCFTDKLSNLNIDTEDNAEIIFKLQSGAFAELHLDYIQETYRRNCEIIGDRGMLLFDLTKNSLDIYTRESKEWQKIYLDIDVNEMYIKQTEYFMDCIDKKQAPLVGIDKARQILEVALAAKNSSQESKVIKFAQK